MSAIFLVLAMATAPAQSKAFVRNFGPAIEGKRDCYAVGDRYAACVKFDEAGELERIDVEPRASLSEEQFDRDQALSQAEYLDVMTKIGHAVDVGEYERDDRPHAYAILNGLIAPVETWTNAAVRKWIVDGADTVLEINVIFYRKVSGRIRMEPCTPIAVPGLMEVPCSEISPGPDYVTIDNVDYLVAPRDQRKFTAGEAVDIYVADLRN